MSDSVLLEVDDAVATITLNRPEARNALTAEMKVGLLDALRRCGCGPAVRVGVLTGAGQAFCAGQDLREHADVTGGGRSPLGTVRRALQPDGPGDPDDAQAGDRRAAWGGGRRGRVARLRLRLPDRRPPGQSA